MRACACYLTRVKSHALLIVLAACSDNHDRPLAATSTRVVAPTAVPTADDAATLFDEIPLRPELPPGISDLSLDDRGHLWAVPERDHVVLELALEGTPITIRDVEHPLDGVPAGVDTESIAWLGHNRFAIGTEGQEEATASVMFGELRSDGHIALTRTLPLTDTDVRLELVQNHGVEGICGTGDDVIAAIESFGTLADGTRYAPLVHIHGEKITAVTKLHLTSNAGKISALFCTFAADGTAQVLAIERHYGVSRILTFAVPPTATDVTPAIAMDLWPIVRDRYREKLNLEGIVRMADGRWVLVNDNQGKFVEGATRLFVFHPR
ncbi:hypothetical protein BH11MYX1_BH11MYX1_44720 [soil metagenome]